MKLLLTLLFVLISSITLYPAEGEIILNDTSLIINEERKEKKNTKQNTKNKTNKNIIQKTTKSTASTKKDKTNNNNSGTKERAKELKYLNNFIKKSLFLANDMIDNKIKNAIDIIFAELNKNKKEHSLEMKRLIGSIKRENTFVKMKAKKRNSTISSLQIISIRIGKDRPKKEVLGGSRKSLPIVITVLSPKHIKQGILKVYVKNINSKKEYLIYELNPFQLNNRWAQDQNIWNGSYIKNSKRIMLPKGRYQLYSVLKISERVYIRFWGKGRKDYYVSVI